MPKNIHGKAVGLNALDEALCDADIVISSTGAPSYIVTEDMVRHCLRKRKNRLLFLVDIAVPRDIDPAADGIENVYLYNIDNLQDIVDENIKNRRRESLKAEGIVQEEVAQYANWLKELEAVPTIVSLRSKAEGIVRMEMAKAENWMSTAGNRRPRKSGCAGEWHCQQDPACADGRDEGRKRRVSFAGYCGGSPPTI